MQTQRSAITQCIRVITQTSVDLVCGSKHKTMHSNICLKPSCYLGVKVYAQLQEVQVDIDLSLGTSPSGSIQSNSIYDQTHACFLHCLPSFTYIQDRLDTFIEPVKVKYTSSTVSHIKCTKTINGAHSRERLILTQHMLS